MFLLHVIPEDAGLALPFGGEPGAAGVELLRLSAELKTRAGAELKEIAEREFGGGAPWEILVERGAPAAGIVRAAKSWNADLVVIATHGRTGLARVLLWSVAEQVVRRVPCPVLTVRSLPDGATLPEIEARGRAS